jgi:hypothetical protein
MKTLENLKGEAKQRLSFGFYDYGPLGQRQVHNNIQYQRIAKMSEMPGKRTGHSGKNGYIHGNGKEEWEGMYFLRASRVERENLPRGKVDLAAPWSASSRARSDSSTTPISIRELDLPYLDGTAERV